MKQAFEVKAIFSIFMNKWKLILLVVLVFTLAGGMVSFAVPPIYQAKTDILINQTMKNKDSTVLTSGEIESNLQLIETYKYILKSDRIVNKVNAVLKESYKKSDLLKKVKIESNNNTQILTVVAEEKSPKKAALLANTFASTFQKEIQTLMNFDNVHLLNDATVELDTKLVKPIPVIYFTVSFLIGLCISTMIVIIKEVYFTVLDTPQKMEKALGIPTLGTTPFIEGKTKNHTFLTDERYLKMIPQLEFSPQIIEAFRTLRANLQFIMTQQEVKTILLTSSVPGEGKSITSGNLAVIMAMDNKKTIYVDADLRKATGRMLFNTSNRKGITSFISGNSSIEEIVQETEIKNLSFIAAGPIPPNPSELLSTNMLKKLLDDLKKRFDVIIVDSPPLILADAVILSTKVDGCIFVADAFSTKQDLAVKSIEQLQKVKAPLLGSILNKSRLEGAASYYY
ncbi:polysaccharide biosynthesis tyrosine autokinase [Peribacillus glennii]|uniref:non-specific protein-tyrosine kinase n=1 Tax=Peribacillus glennii TaxID=2303991 RepID=A0A372LEY5_9BACI|nr:polysaccharide biosynthesis tyrosine autokinase [Peribacillus glennii]RFU64883.1 polysaccharide biosynthesis tyrosine autokinase [Peribacillus glennii]